MVGLGRCYGVRLSDERAVIVYRLAVGSNPMHAVHSSRAQYQWEEHMVYHP
jgi:hypothetical protein